MKNKNFNKYKYKGYASNQDKNQPEHILKLFLNFEKIQPHVLPTQGTGFSCSAKLAIRNPFLFQPSQTSLSVSTLSDILVCFNRLRHHCLFPPSQTSLPVSTISDIRVCFNHLRHHCLFQPSQISCLFQPSQPLMLVLSIWLYSFVSNVSDIASH